MVICNAVHSRHRLNDWLAIPLIKKPATMPSFNKACDLPVLLNKAMLKNVTPLAMKANRHVLKKCARPHHGMSGHIVLR